MSSETLKTRSHRHYLLAIFDQVIVAASALIITVVISRTAGLDGLGLFVLCQTALLFGSVIHAAFVTMPLATSYPIFDAKSAGVNRDQYFVANHLLVSSLILVTSIVFAVFCNILLADEISVTLLVAVAAAVLPLVTFSFFRAIWLARFDYVRAVIMDATYGLLASLGLVLGSFSDISGVFFLLAASWTVSCMLGIPAIPNWWKQVFKSSEIAKRVWLEGRWLFGLRAITYFRSTIVVYLIALLTNTSSVGTFRIIQSLYGPMSVLTASLDSFLPQNGAKLLRDRGVKHLHRLMAFVVGLIVLCIIVYAGFIIFFREEIFESFFSVKVPNAISLLVAQALASACVVVNTVVTILVRIAGNEKSLTFAPLIEVAVLIIPGTILVWYFSTLGAIIWAALGSIINAIILAYLFNHKSAYS